MDLYRATSNPRLLQQCEAAWQDVAQSQDLLITGGVPEGWSPSKHSSEGCAEVDWLRLSLSLWKGTANPRYLSMAERTTFNEFALNQFATGDFSHRVLTGTGVAADGARRAWWCCTLHGLHCFPDVHTSAFHNEDEALCYDLPLDSQMDNGPTSTASLSAAATSSFARDGAVGITITSAGESPASLCVRKPEWADTLAIRLNNALTQCSLEGGYVHIHRRWQTGDVLTVCYGMSLRSQSGDKRRVTYSYGLWLLGALVSDDPPYFNELTTENKLSLGKVQPLSAATHPARPFAVPIAVTNFHYTPAGFPEQQQTVTLRAVAEQTGQPTTSWKLRFLTEDTV